jgi:diguanylate cyclase (GGDEF)-like protein/PAS domain S-box-containing protein
MDADTVGPFGDQAEAALEAFLRAYPQARVGAVSPDGAGLIPLPVDLPIGGSFARLTTESAVSAVAKGDRALIARLWWQARLHGTASATIQLDGDVEKITLGLFDLRRDYGVTVLVAVEAGESAKATLSESSRQLPGPVRFARVVKDGTAQILEVDEAFERMLGYDRNELVGLRTVELVHPDDQDEAVEQWISMLDVPGPSRPMRLRHRCKDGRWIWLEVSNHNRLDDPEHRDVVAYLVDVSEEISTLEAVRARQQLLELVTASIPIGLLHADLEGRLLYANQQLTDITGLTVGSRLQDLPGVATHHHRTVVNGALSGAFRGTTTDTVIELIGSMGETRHCAFSIRPLVDGTGAVTGVTGSVEDVTSSVVERRELEVRAATDSLTGCLNRSATLAVIQDSLDDLSEAEDRDFGVAALFVDVDGLKLVNDRLGHQAGDALLVEVAARLHAAVRVRDAVGRYGGDEFVVVTTHVASAEQALNLARWVSSRIMRSFQFDSEVLPIRASVGVAWTGNQGVQAQWLVRQADRAMYESKRLGKGTPVLAGAQPDRLAAPANARDEGRIPESPQMSRGQAGA